MLLQLLSVIKYFFVAKEICTASKMQPKSKLLGKLLTLVRFAACPTRCVKTIPPRRLISQSLFANFSFALER